MSIVLLGVFFCDLIFVVFVASVPFAYDRMGFALGLGVLPQKMLHGKLDQVQGEESFSFLPQTDLFFVFLFLSLHLPSLCVHLFRC